MKLLVRASLLAVLVIFTGFIFTVAQDNTSSPIPKSSVSLTPEEQAWLEDHPQIVLGIDAGWDPMVRIAGDSTLSGLDVDFLELLNNKLGTNIQLTVGNWSEMVAQAQAHQIDGLTSSAAVKQRREHFLFTESYLKIFQSVLVRSDAGFQVNSLEDLRGRKIAVQKNNVFVSNIIDRIQNATSLPYSTELEAVKQMVKGEADVTIATIPLNKLVEVGLFNVRIAYTIQEYPLPVVYSIRKDWPELISILNKGINAITDQEKIRILKKYMSVEHARTRLLVNLTSEEQAWLDQNYAVRVRIVDSPPFMILGEGKPTGISIDYLENIAVLTGVNFQYVQEIRPYAEAYRSMTKFQEPDLMQCMRCVPEQEVNALFSREYFSTPQVIFMRNKADFISGIDGLSGKKVTVARETFISNKLQTYFPDSNLVQFDSDYEAIGAVSTGQADAYIGNLTVASYLIQKHNLSNLKIAAPGPFAEQVLSFVIRPDWPELASIINKALENMSEDEHVNILNKYVAFRYQYGVNPSEIRKWGGISFVMAMGILIIFFLWNRRLKKLVLERTTNLADSEMRYRSVIEDSPLLICTYNKDWIIVLANNAYCDYFGKNQEEIIGTNFFSLIPEEDREIVKANISSLTPGKPIQSHEHRVIIAKGQIMWQRWINRGLFDSNGNLKIYQAFGEDITERKLAKENLLNMQTYVQHLIETANVMIVSLDTEGKVIHFNPAAEEITGYTVSEIKGKNWFDTLVPRNKSPDVHKEFHRLMEGGLPKLFENPIITKSGQERFISWSNSEIRRGEDITGITSFGIDITERRKAELELSQSEERYRTLFEGSQNGIIIADVSTRKFKYANSAAAEMLGYTIEELCNLGVDDIHPPEELERVHAEFDAQIRGESMLAYQLPCLKKDSSIIYANVSANQLTTTEGNFSVGFFTDVTKHKMAEEGLKQSEEKFRNLIEQSPVSIQIHDPGGKLMQSNAAYARLFALSEDALNELYEKYNVLEDEQAGRLGLTPYIKKVFEGEESIFPNYEYNGVDTLKTLDFKNPVSRTCWIRTHGYPIKDKDGNVTKAVFMSEDITEQKQAEKKIQESEEKYRELVEQAQDGITIIQYGEIRFANPSLIKLIGYTIDELLDTPFTNYIHPDELKKVTDIYQRRINGKPAPSIYESVLLTKEGQPLEVEFNARVIRINSKPADLVIIRNISERKRVEKKMISYQNRLKELAAQLTLVEEKERRRIATDLHDQIGQILASTRIQLVSMKKNIDSTSLNKEIEDISANLRQAIEDTRHIISDLSSPLLSELGLPAAISEWMEENMENRHGLKASLNCKTKLPELDEDIAIMLYRSVKELLTNVIKHARASKVEVFIETNQDMLKLRVRDNGIGFRYDPQWLSSKAGNRLGLFSIRERMTDLGGEMEVKTDKLKGTEITLMVPVRREKLG